MRRRVRNLVIAAVIFFILLPATLMPCIASVSVDKDSANKSAPPTPWTPPGWVGPTTPPPNTLK